MVNGGAQRNGGGGGNFHFQTGDFGHFNMHSAEEIFRNFFGGRDPFANFFDDDDDFFGGGFPSMGMGMRGGMGFDRGGIQKQRRDPFAGFGMMGGFDDDDFFGGGFGGGSGGFTSFQSSSFGMGGGGMGESIS